MSGTMEAGSYRYEVTALAEFQMTWLKTPSPVPRTCVEIMRRRTEEGQKAQEEAVRQIERQGYQIHKIVQDLNERFGTTRSQRLAQTAGQLPSPGNWNWYDARFMIAECLGAPEPEWDEVTHSWWQTREHHCLDWVRSVSDVNRIPVPDWKNTEPVARMLASHQRWVEAFPDDPGWARIWYLTLPSGYRSPFGGEAAAGINYASFVDLGIFLLGTTRFLTVLGGERELADALMDKCFELSTSYTEFVLSVHPEKWEALVGFGGDVTCMLSPRLYDKYGLAWDARLFEYVQETHATPATPDDLPCNLHSCGPSAHLYAQWGRHPYRKNITTMQTRLLPGQVKPLRENLPHTVLQLTFHPQHFDLAHVAPAEVKRVMWESARDAGFRDLHLTIFAVAQQPEDLGQLEMNVKVCYETLDEIVTYSEERSPLGANGRNRHAYSTRTV